VEAKAATMAMKSPIALTTGFIIGSGRGEPAKASQAARSSDSVVPSASRIGAFSVA
jgi:hypothetical protein